MEVESMNFTAWYLAQKLVCLEDIEGGKFDVVCASAESATDKRFLQSLKKSTTFSVAVWWLALQMSRIQLKHELFSPTVWIYFHKL